MHLNKLKRKENNKMEENVIDEMPFGITEDEVESQEVIEELNVKVGEDDESTNK